MADIIDFPITHVIQADSLSVDVCQHGSVTITFYDKLGKPFARGDVGPEAGLEISQDILDGVMAASERRTNEQRDDGGQSG